MKTIVYNPQREILTALLTLILSFSLLTAIKAQGNSGPLSVNEAKTEMNEEKASKITNTELTGKVASDNFLVKKIESWISNGSYWDKSFEEATVENKLTDKIKRWMSDGSFWSSGSSYMTDIDELALSKKEQNICDAMAEGGK